MQHVTTAVYVQQKRCQMLLKRAARCHLPPGLHDQLVATADCGCSELPDQLLEALIADLHRAGHLNNGKWRAW